MVKKIGKKDIFTLPNVLSLLRIFMAPLFAFLYFKQDYIMAATVLLVSGLTDVLDGIIARKFNLITTVGKILDPVADKLTQAIIIFCMTINHYEDENSLLIFVLILLFAKEFTMLLGAIVLFKAGARPSESKWKKKLGTVMIYFLFIAILLQDILTTQYISVVAINVICVITAICLLFSLFNYYPIFKEIQNGEYKFEKEKNSDNK